MADQPLLRVKNLKTYFKTSLGESLAVDDISFDIHSGKTLALVGESGCGKSVTSLSIMGLVPQPPGWIAGGEVLLDGKDLLQCTPREMNHIRSHDISMIFQEPMTSLNPVFRVGTQLGEAFRLHKKMSKKDARDASIEILAKVGIPSPEVRVDDYPFQLSGGMRQRVMIAIALACDPKLLIADEPTTALDVTVQAQILNLLQALQQDFKMAILLITHDLGVVAEMSDDVAIMYAGKIVQTAEVHELFDHPLHPYTVGLFNSLPQMGAHSKRLHTIEGYVPAADTYPPGCRFCPRCEFALPVCEEQIPPLMAMPEGHQVACWLHDEETMSALGRRAGLPEGVKSS